MELHGRGFKCSAGRLDTMVRAKDVKPRRGPDGRTFEWTTEDVDRAAQVLTDNQEYTPEAFSNLFLGIHADQRREALHSAWKALRDQFPHQLAFNPNADLFVMTVHPPRYNHDGYVTYTPNEDVLRSLHAEKPAATAEYERRRQLLIAK
jgi:hypothetical protein